MKAARLLLLALCLPLLAAAEAPAPLKDTAVDFDKARQLFEKRQRGETLTADEAAYIERAKAEHAKQEMAKNSDGIDWEKAKELHRRSEKGETLSADEQAYLDKAKAAMQKRGRGERRPDGIDWEKAKALHERAGRGEKLTDEEQAYLKKAMEARGGGGDASGGDSSRPRNRDQREAPAHLTPLCDLGTGKYEDEDGGLYGGGSNEPPEAQAKAATAALKEIQPLDKEGKPAADGRIVFVSISMSNATQEFSTFVPMANTSASKSPQVTVVDCAQGGQAMAQWVPEDGRPWQEAMARLDRAAVSPQQVQVAWVKLANVGPSGSMADHLGKLESDTTKVLQNAKRRFPNLRIAYLGSRIYAGYAKSALNPEPYAYEGAFAVRHLIQKQIKGDADLAPDKAPLLLWGPYLWADGSQGRKIDDLKWLPEDLGPDGTHPSTSGREKVAKLLLDFVTTNPFAKPWFEKK